ncbi:dynein heavy chain 11, axonemal isoform X1 [Electrophorus electricus]|uniref:dynein heavy chain 11, axonemal isoform X1 n=1 Tax=Electrophorus electricus TaxID=8005 RepID=UPI0015D0A4D8|nr:dynein heavy chain 11, axonemal isoform X1 [Electrophorus electricus]
MLEEEETPPQFSEDERVEFIGMRICQMLNMNTVSWNKFVTVEENQRLLTDYFEKQVKLLFFIPAAPTVLTASTEVSFVPECKTLYILKKESVPILSENYRSFLLFGVLSPALLLQLSNIVDKVCLPLLSNKKNHLLWPNVISQDVTQHIESLSNKVSVVKGQVYGKTVLPVPAVAGKTEDSLESFLRPRTAVHAVESMVINWTRLIQKVLKEDSADLILKGLNPEPMTELDFWRSRKKNIENIYEQIQSPAIQKMVRILEVADSSYYPCFKTVTEEVIDALQEVRDVDVHLQQLRPLLLQVQEGEFSSIRMFIRPLFHLVFLVWTHCTSYRMPARLVVLLQELANLLIQQASSYLGAEELLRGETEETLEKLQIVVKLLRCFKDTYHTYREKVTAWASAKGIHKWWDFPSALVFTRFNCFLARVLMLEDLFSTMLELQNLEKLIFGGTKGRMYTEQVSLLHSEFQQLCKKIRDAQHNPLDLMSKHFEQDYAHFKQTVTDYDRRLGSILCLAYKDCSGLESIFKLLALFKPFLDRGIIKEMFAPNFTKLIHHFGVELERCKHLFNSYLEQRKKGKAMLCKNMPAMSGAMKWAKMMRDRIQIPWENFRFVLDMTLEGAAMEMVYHKYEEMSTLLDEFEEEVYSHWCDNVKHVCQMNLDQPLIRRDLSSGLLSVNFNLQLLDVLRDVRHLQMLDQTSIPSAAMEVYEKRDTFLMCISSLQLLVQGYNKVCQSAVDVEAALLKAELEAIDKQLHQAETELRWQDQECWDYICQVRDTVHDLERRLQKSRDNVGTIQELMKGWCKQPMFCRKDNKKDTLLMLDDRAARVTKKYSGIRNDGEAMHHLMQENKHLYAAVDGSEAWQQYVEYVDEMVAEGLFNAITHSLEFFVDNMERSVKQAPLLEAQMLLRGAEIVFRPSLDKDSGAGLRELVEGLLADVFRMSTQVKRVASHLDLKDYQNDINDMLDLLDLRQEVMERVNGVIRSACQYQGTFEVYSHLWLDERAEFLRQFLLYGQPLTTEYVEAYGEHALPETPPTTDKFKDQIDHYEELYAQVSKLEDWRVFDSWFRVDTRSLKMSLLNTIKKWSWMFKEHLISYVTDSITELEEFIVRAASGLREPVRSGDYQALVQVMGYLLSVRARQPSTDQLFEPLRAVAGLLEQYGEMLPDHIYNQLEELPEKWSSVKKLAWCVKHEVAPLQNAEVAVIRRKYGAFERKLSQFEEKFRTEAPFLYKSVSPYLRLDKCHGEVMTLQQELLELQESCKLFEVSSPDLRQLRLWQRETVVLKQLWDLLFCAQSSIAAWTGNHWRGINVELMDAELRRFAKEMETLDKEARGWDSYIGLDHALKDLLTSLRVVKELQNPAMRARHWTQLVRITRMDFTLTERTTLADLLVLQLHLYEEEVHNTVAKAVKEIAIERVLIEISQTWTLMEFTYEEHLRTSTPLLKCDDDLIERLEEHQVQLQAMLQTKQVEFFHEQVQALQAQLTHADSVLLLWLEVQRTWTHLESIFMGSDDIRQHLPADTHRFHAINADFKDLMFKSSETKNVIAATNRTNLLEILEDLQIRLDVCEKALAKYLETKRKAFPRFYFVSSTDLLDILSKGSQPEKVTQHLAKLFDSMADLQFGEGGHRTKEKPAVGMFSREREFVSFHSQCDCVGPVELWLGRLEEAMREAVRRRIAEATAVYEDRPREQWVLEQPAQAALTASQIWWSADVGLAFQRLAEGFDTALRDYSRKQIAQLNSLISMLLGELSPGDRRKIMTICTIDVHARDVVSRLIAQKVSSASAFVWHSQLRHRWDEEQRHCYASICDAHFLYSYEYLGNTPRLVITPLTDRCYVTLTQSLHLTMSGAPAGPAGTGKTETTKDLGKALGVMVYVFNCSEQMDYKSVGNIFKGLSQTGAWGCFDEFNRIAAEVLSVVAVQVKTIQDAIRHSRTRFVFLEEEVTLRPTVGIFITMNPGYAGRTELPENLKALFRPCAMVVPDMELICEIMLMAEGFLNARNLGRKFITLYKLCKDLLSKQDHYDWGLRAVKSVLVVAGALKREDKARPEDQVLMRALRDFNMPKIVSEDVPAFLGLIGDLFPGVEAQRLTDAEFEQLARQSALELTLQPEEPFILKVVQLEELMSVRHSVFVVGDAGTGKSQILRTLYRTYFNMKMKPVWNDLNPKAISTDELFGFTHSATREWKDGLLSCFMREHANNPHPGPKWLVLDGDIDPMWIESLNTVMDDNKVLTLASNERILLTPSMRLVFESSCLSNATPATVSRAGILYVNPQDLSWNLYVTSWIDRRQRQTERAHLTILFDKYVSRCIEQMKSTFKTVIAIPENSMVQTLCSLLDCLLTPEHVPADSSRDVYETYFVFACIWAFGGATCQDQLRDYRAEFSEWWTKEMKSIKLPAHGSVFDHYLDPRTRRFSPWADKIPAFHMEPDTPVQAVWVPTAESGRLQYFLRLLLGSAQPLMLVGGAGTGKTSLVRDLLDALPDTFLTAHVPLHYYSTSSTLQRMLEKPLEKKAGRNYTPPGSKKLIYFVDDMNMAAVDNYGTVQPHALIRQHLDYEHWYDRQKLSLKEIHNTQYIACLNPQAGSCTVNPRLQRHFVVLAVSNPTREALVSIYGSILNMHLQSLPFDTPVLGRGPAVARAAAALHQSVLQHFLPSATRFQHVFSLWDLTQLFQGLLFSTPECVKQGSDLIRLWVHESRRVYSDRLADAEDQQLFYRLQADVAHQAFEGLEEQLLLQEPLLYLPSGAGSAQPRYIPAESWDWLNQTLTEALCSYNCFHATMNLVLFQEAMQHVCRISRVLASPRGHALLVGVGGSGKQSLTRLAAHLCGMDLFQPTLSNGYGIQELKVDVAGLCVKAGVKNLPTVLLLTDAHIPNEHVVVVVTALLSSGEVPELLSDEEVSGAVKAVRREVRSLGLLDTVENCWRLFTERVRRQLKVVLCMSPVGKTLRGCVRRFPALLSCTTLDWFHEWPQEALHSVSLRFLQDLPGIEPAFQEPISLFLAHAHASAKQAGERYRRAERRHTYSTPRSFLELLSLYGSLLERKREQLQQRLARLRSGLQELKTTAAQVEDLKAKLGSQEVDLTLKSQAAEALITKIGRQTERLSQKRADADLEEQKVAAIQAEVTRRQRDCEHDLAKAEPALEAATAALDTLNKVNLTELKTFPNPPEAVTNVMAAVMVLLAPRGRVPKDRGWKAARVFMGKLDDFLQALMCYDKEHIPEQCLSVVKQEYLSNRHFHPDHVRTKSFAAAGLCAWTINIMRYYELYCEVAPKRLALSQANTELENATAKLLTVRKKLHDLDGHLQNLTAQFERAAAEKLCCQEEVTRTRQTIELANRLVGGLQSENVRWSEAELDLQAQQDTLCGDVLLAAAFVSYAGPFTQPYRQQLLQEAWKPFFRQLRPPVPLTEGLDPVLLLAEQAAVAAWHNQGLPADRLSVENAVILTCSQRWPVLVDPQQQASRWLRGLYGPGLRVLQCGAEGYMEEIMRALACGEAVLIENVEERTDPVLEPLLVRSTAHRGRSIRLGGKECEYNSTFQLLLHTKLANPHFPPELQAHTTLINFSVTQGGLEEQLLGQVVRHERPDLESLKVELSTQQNLGRIELKGLEEELLSGLSAAKGSFLQNAALVQQLEYTKSTAAHVRNKVIEAQENEMKLNEARELYRPIAQRAALLYFTVKELHNINPMYQYSLKSFSTVFHRALEQAPRDQDVAVRVHSLTEAVTYSVFLYASQGLFQRDRLTFLSHTAFQILLMRGSIEAEELELLLRLPVEFCDGSPVSFLSAQAWGAIRALSVVEAFRGLDRDVEGSAKRWRKLVESECPERERLPLDWKKKSTLQKLIILRAMRPDRMSYALRNFVEESLGSRYVDTGGVEFEKSYEETNPSTPVFFILSPGVNPLKDVETLGLKLGFSIELGNLHHVSLGQGQESVAEKALHTAAAKGHWVILQNVHLVERWLGHLEDLLESTGRKAHPHYRVFMSGEPAPSPDEHIIPRGILENALKLTHEPPTGMNASLHAALHHFSQDTLEMSSREQEFKGLLFSLCYFHAGVSERRKFGPQGWNRCYPFNGGDLTISVNVLYNCLEAHSKVPWEDLCYLVGEIMYGGHITDNWDRRLCCTYLQELINPKMFEEVLFLCPGFPAPPELDYAGYHTYVDARLPAESPSLYGLHLNAEIGYMTAADSALFRTLLELQPRDWVAGAEAAQSADDKVKSVLEDLLDRLPEEYDVAELQAKTAERSPLVLVCVQECERMNLLLTQIHISLKNLDLAMKGELSISADMETLQTALFYDRVPENWSKLTYPSTKTLAQWFLDVLTQCRELDTWTQDFVLPAVVWLPGFFSPQSFLTAIMQSIARKNKWPLDKMTLSVDVTKKTKDDYGHPPREGAYIHGLYIEGARWDTAAGVLAEALLKELAPAMPVLYVRAVPADQPEPSGTYECPVYRTKLRGPSFVWSFRLRTRHPPAKWVLAGVALLLSA